MISLTFGSPGTPLMMMTLDYFKYMYKVMVLLSISQVAQSRISSASGTILIYLSERKDLLISNVMSYILSQMING